MATPNISAVLKLIQSDEFDDSSMVRKSPFLTSIKHEKDFAGEAFKFSVQHSGLGGRSHDSVIAEGNDVGGGYAAFTVSSVSDFKLGKLDGQTTRKALNAGVTEKFVKYVANEMKQTYASLNAELARGACASSTGSRGQVGSFSGSTITMKRTDDSMYVSIGDVLRVSATDGGAHRTGSVTVLGVNTATGVITTTAAVTSGISAIANDDYIYVSGDLNKSWSGLGAWCPASDPSPAENFYGVDRSVNPEFLAGLRYAGTGTNTETVLIRAAAYARKRPSDAFEKFKVVCSEEDFASVQVAKEGARVIDDDNQYGIGVQTFMLGSAPVMPDPFCPSGTYFIVGDGAFELHTNDGVVIDEADGNQIRRTAGDTYSFMGLVDGQFVAPKPYGILRGLWPAG